MNFNPTKHELILVNDLRWGPVEPDLPDVEEAEAADAEEAPLYST